jgi:hypothetical protein
MMSAAVSNCHCSSIRGVGIPYEAGSALNSIGLLIWTVEESHG